MASNSEFSEDKLQRFSRYVWEQASAQRDGIRRSLRQQRDSILSQARQRCQRDASDKLKKAQAALMRETNEALSRAQLDAKKATTLHRTEIMESVFDDVRAKLHTFQEGATYYPWLLATAKSAVAQLGGGNIEITLSIKDAPHARKLEVDCGVPVKLANEDTDFFGGIRAENRTANTVFSDTFDDRLAEQKSEFLKLCGIIV